MEREERFGQVHRVQLRGRVGVAGSLAVGVGLGCRSELLAGRRSGRSPVIANCSTWFVGLSALGCEF